MDRCLLPEVSIGNAFFPYGASKALGLLSMWHCGRTMPALLCLFGLTESVSHNFCPIYGRPLLYDSWPRNFTRVQFAPGDYWEGRKREREINFSGRSERGIRDLFYLPDKTARAVSRERECVRYRVRACTFGHYVSVAAPPPPPTHTHKLLLSVSLRGIQ